MGWQQEVPCEPEQLNQKQRPSPISVLYIHPCGVFGGASRSLLELIQAFPENSVSPYLITQKGNVANIFVHKKVPVIATQGISQFDNTQYSYYRGYRWLLLIREFFYSIFTLDAILKAKRKWKNIDLIHVNEITALPAVVLGKIIFKKPIIVHCRSVQRQKEKQIRFRLIEKFLKSCAVCMVAIDKTVKKNLKFALDVEVIHNGFAVELTSKGEKKDANLLKLNAMAENSLKVGFVGNFMVMKGIYEFIEAARICIDKHLDIDFFIVGDNIRSIGGFRGWILDKLNFWFDVKADIIRLIKNYQLNKSVHLLGFIDDIRQFYENIDIICFPSHLNAVGRPVIEAAFFKVPAIVCINNPIGDTIIDGETGICVEPKDARGLAEGIEHLYNRRDEMRRMGESAYRLAMKNFSIQENARRVLEIYRRYI